MIKFLAFEYQNLDFFGSYFYRIFYSILKILVWHRIIFQKSSAHSSGPEDSGCGTSSCEDIEEIDVESVETSSNENLKSSSFSISNLLKEKSESSKLKPSIFSNPYSHPLYPYSHLPYPLNLFQGSPKIISSISSNYQKPRKSPFEKTQTVI